MVGCIFEMGIELLEIVWILGNGEKRDGIIIFCMIVMERLFKL